MTLKVTLKVKTVVLENIFFVLKELHAYFTQIGQRDTYFTEYLFCWKSAILILLKLFHIGQCPKFLLSTDKRRKNKNKVKTVTTCNSMRKQTLSENRPNCNCVHISGRNNFAKHLIFANSIRVTWSKEPLLTTIIALCRC